MAQFTRKVHSPRTRFDFRRVICRVLNVPVIALALIVFSFSSFSQEQGPNPLDRWTRRNPLGTLDNLNGITFAEGRFVAVGANGAVTTSTNGTEWDDIKISSDRLDAVAAGGGTFVAISPTNVFATDDLITWSSTELDAALSSVDITFGNGIFLLVRNGRFPNRSVVLSSRDGVSWVESVRFEHRVTAIAFGADQFVAVGDDGVMQKSADGADWQVQVSGTEQDFVNVLYEDGEFVATGTTFSIPESGIFQKAVILRSADGSTWADDPTFPEVWSAASGNGTYVGVTTGFDTFKRDGPSAWETIGSPERENQIAFGDGTFVVVGRNGHIGTSSDGLQWAKQNPRTITRNGLSDIAYGNGRFVAVGGAVLHSLDGRSWQNVYSEEASGLGTIEFLNGRFFAAGHSGRIATSTNGLDWKILYHHGGSSSLHSILYGYERYIAVGLTDSAAPAPLLVQSRNGIEWEEVPVEGRGFGSVAFGDGRFVSLGFTVRISTNGFQWDEMTSKPPRNTTSIAYGAGRFVSVGEGISVSSDGLNWTDLACCEGPFAEVVYANGVFLTAGYDAKMFSSTDGTNWTRHPSPWPEYINGTPTYIGGITFGQGRFVIAGGGSGFIVESGQLVPEFDAGQFHVGTDGSARIRVEAYRGQNLQLEASSDLGDWTPLTNGTLADDFLEYTESPGPSPERRFYRAKLLPEP